MPSALRHLCSLGAITVLMSGTAFGQFIAQPKSTPLVNAPPARWPGVVPAPKQETPSPWGQVRFELVMGPFAKVLGPGEVDPTPLVANATFQILDEGGRVITKGRTDRQGAWQGRVPAGKGTIWIQRCPGAGGQLPPRIGYTVRPGGGTGIRIACKSHP